MISFQTNKIVLAITEAFVGVMDCCADCKQGSNGSWKTWKVLEFYLYNYFILAFSRTGKSWKKATGPGKLWKCVKLDQKNMKCMEGSKEN